MVNVSMPCVGLIPFLQPILFLSSETAGCVNALCRAYSISTVKPKPDEPVTPPVSMPCVGLIPFLLKNKDQSEEKPTVSMPCVGLIPFLPEEARKIADQMHCVNALCRAYSISTL